MCSLVLPLVYGVEMRVVCYRLVIVICVDQQKSGEYDVTRIQIVGLKF